MIDSTDTWRGLDSVEESTNVEGFPAAPLLWNVVSFRTINPLNALVHQSKTHFQASENKIIFWYGVPQGIIEAAKSVASLNSIT